jgi:hypothetical protein
MSSVHLHTQNPDGTTRAFDLTEHDIFLLGRMKDCHLCLPNDQQVSRHHFILEACPPQAALRDLGSMNGTHVNLPKPVSDVWSFAASLYQLLTGKFPYRFDPKRDPIDIILNENPVPIRDGMPGLQKEISTVIDKALVRNPKDRFPDAGKLLAAIS